MRFTETDQTTSQQTRKLTHGLTTNVRRIDVRYSPKRKYTNWWKRKNRDEIQKGKNDVNIPISETPAFYLWRERHAHMMVCCDMLDHTTSLRCPPFSDVDGERVQLTSTRPARRWARDDVRRGPAKVCAAGTTRALTLTPCRDRWNELSVYTWWRKKVCVYVSTARLQMNNVLPYRSTRDYVPLQTTTRWFGVGFEMPPPCVWRWTTLDGDSTVT